MPDAESIQKYLSMAIKHGVIEFSMGNITIKIKIITRCNKSANITWHLYFIVVFFFPLLGVNFHVLLKKHTQTQIVVFKCIKNHYYLVFQCKTNSCFVILLLNECQVVDLNFNIVFFFLNLLCFKKPKI